MSSPTAGEGHCHIFLGPTLNSTADLGLRAGNPRQLDPSSPPARQAVPKHSRESGKNWDTGPELKSPRPGIALQCVTT